mgnify:FL=1
MIFGQLHEIHTSNEKQIKTLMKMYKHIDPNETVETDFKLNQKLVENWIISNVGVKSDGAIKLMTRRLNDIYNEIICGWIKKVNINGEIGYLLARFKTITGCEFDGEFEEYFIVDSKSNLYEAACQYNERVLRRNVHRVNDLSTRKVYLL